MKQRNLTNNLIDNRSEDKTLSSSTQNRRIPSSVATVDTRTESVAVERLEAAGRLAAWVAHQINNPLGAISGNAQLLARRLQRDIDDPGTLKAYLKYIEAIQSQTERCAKITGEALNFAQPGEPDLRPVNVLDVIREAIELVCYAHPSSPVTFRSEDQPDLPEIRADREWLTRVLFELLSNAVVASQGGIVKLKTSLLPGHGDRPSKVRVRISDCGPGIADDVLPRVFDPFFSTREKARGLGLTLSLEMMRKMGGGLRVEKSDSAGSVFTIGIPIWGRQN